MAASMQYALCLGFSNPGLCFTSKFLRPNRQRVNPVTKCRQRAAAVEQLQEQQQKHLLQFTEYAKRKLPSINEALQEAVRPREPGPERLHEAMRYSLLSGGKRLRPVLCLASFEIFAASAQAESVDAEIFAASAQAEYANAEAAAMAAACAMEMVHTMSLMHDDLPCVDDGDLRRGRPSSHRVFGEGVALFAGDALLVRAFEHLAEATPARVPPDRVLRLVRELGRAGGSQGLMGGQVMDVLSEGDASADLGRLQEISLGKTAAMFECAAACGAIAGGAGDDCVERLRSYARSLGLLFQVVDDILDVTQSTQVLGKTAGNDAVAGKITYPKLMGLQQARTFAEQLAVTAKQHLSPFDSATAGPLLGLPDYVLLQARSTAESSV